MEFGTGGLILIRCARVCHTARSSSESEAEMSADEEEDDDVDNDDEDGYEEAEAEEEESESEAEAEVEDSEVLPHSPAAGGRGEGWVGLRLLRSD